VLVYYLELNKFQVIAAKMLCGYIRFKLKPKVVSNSFKSFLMLRDFLISEQTTFEQSKALLLKGQEISRESAGLLVTLKREVVIEPRVKSRFQALNNID
jgi:hypothetical protein